MRMETERAMDNAHFSSAVISAAEYEAEKAWGLLASINLYGCNKEKITTPAVMRDFITALTAEINMKAHGEPMIEKFAEGHLEGYSLLQFIETSSITIHFDDKIGDRAFIDIFSCKYFDAEKARAFCQKYFEAKEAKCASLLRN